MGYLILRDYLRRIQTDQLSQITGANDSIRLTTEGTAQEEIISHLAQKYDTDSEFGDTGIFSSTQTYQANNLVYLDATDWDLNTTYVSGDMVLQLGNVYRSFSTNTGIDPTTNAVAWPIVGAQFTLFYVPVPFPVFDLESRYSVGDVVFWKNKVYSCITATIPIDHESRLQYGQQEAVPFANTFPDDIINGARFWKFMNNYSFDSLFPNQTKPTWVNTTIYIIGDFATYAGVIYRATAININVPPLNNYDKWIPVKWNTGDNRSQLLVTYMVDIALYHMLPRIAPNNIPVIRKELYDGNIPEQTGGAIGWLKRAQKGTVSADIPLLQPSRGRIRSGGNVKQNNHY